MSKFNGRLAQPKAVNNGRTRTVAPSVVHKKSLKIAKYGQL